MLVKSDASTTNAGSVTMTWVMCKYDTKLTKKARYLSKIFY